MSKTKLVFASSPYDLFRDLVLGSVRVDGVDLTALELPVEEIFFRALNFSEFDLNELSFAKYTALCAEGDQRFVGLPIFPSRVFRMSSIFVRPDGPVRTAKDLRGKRIGVPEWAQTAAVFTRGWLMHEIGIGLDEVEWFQAGVDTAGRREKVALSLPAGVRLTPRPDRSLSGMLADGELDAVFSAHPPRRFEEGDPAIVQLFPNAREVEQDYYRRTGIFPIMHVIVLRRSLFEANRWLGSNLMKAFEAARRSSIARALELTASRYPVPWGATYAADARSMFGDDWWPYGVEPNRATLAPFLQYCHEQGVTSRRLEPEELFPREVQASVTV